MLQLPLKVGSHSTLQQSTDAGHLGPAAESEDEVPTLLNSVDRWHMARDELGEARTTAL